MPIVTHEVVGFGNSDSIFFFSLRDAAIIPASEGFYASSFDLLCRCCFFVYLLFMICSFHDPLSSDGTVAETIVSCRWTLPTN